MRRHGFKLWRLAAIPLGLSLALAAESSEPRLDPQTALHEGNRLFRDGRIEESIATYLRGYSPDAPHPTLIYNLGTALHHLDRLPEAILWYRRAAGTGDPWLADNLLLARRGLGSQVLPAGGSLGWFSNHVEAMRWVAVALGWITLVLLIATPRTPGWLLAAAAAAAGSLYGSAEAVERWGQRPAVIVEDCFAPAAELPAGTEAWVRPAAGGWWSISGANGVSCPPKAVELVFPLS